MITGKTSTRIALLLLLACVLFPGIGRADPGGLKPVEPFLLYYKGKAYPAYSPEDHGRLLTQLAKGEAAQKKAHVLEKQARLSGKIRNQLVILEKSFRSLGAGLEKERALRKRLHDTTDKIIQGKDAIIALKGKQVLELKKRIKPLVHEPLFWVGVGVAVLAGAGVGVGIGVALAR